jgi:hypothetical protein
MTKCAKRHSTTYLAVLERTVDQISISLYTRVYCFRDSTSIRDTYKYTPYRAETGEPPPPVGLHVSDPLHLSSGRLYSTSAGYILLPPGYILLSPVIFYFRLLIFYFRSVIFYFQQVIFYFRPCSAYPSSYDARYAPLPVPIC